MRRNKPALFAVPLAGLALSGCQFGIDVNAQGTAAAPIITIERTGPLGFGAPTFKDLDVSEHGGDHRTVWRVSPLNPQCLAPGTRIAYGHTPDQYVASAPPQHLVEGQTYDVFVDGCGPIASATFQIVNGRIVPR